MGFEVWWALIVGTDAVGAQQGASVSLSSDGNTAIVGGVSDNGFGAAWVFTRTGGVWSQQGSKLVGTCAVGSAQQGASASLSSDGNTAIVGGREDNNGVGAAWVYTRNGTGVGDQSVEMPQQFSLDQNYPNPFNPSTTISYALPHRSHVTIAIFNTLGQKVADLVSGEIDAGYHEVQFNATNLASGVYFYRIQAGEFTATKRLLLLK